MSSGKRTNPIIAGLDAFDVHAQQDVCCMRVYHQNALSHSACSDSDGEQIECNDHSCRVLAELREWCMEQLVPLVRGYIWHRDPIHLDVVCPSRSERATRHARSASEQDIRFVPPDPPSLECHLSFGDNIDDEWFLVYLALRLSSRNPALAISIKDNDGQFLLIECAPVLPRWMKPHTSRPILEPT